MNHTNHDSNHNTDHTHHAHHLDSAAKTTTAPLSFLGKILQGFNHYKPLMVILLFCVVLSIIQTPTLHIHNIMYLFMAYFFIFLSLFKFFDLKAFVDGFSSYDLVAMRFPFYGYCYPFIEFLLGCAYLSQFHLRLINLITLIVMCISGIGVLKSVFSGKKLQCACLGTVLNVPLSTVSVLENFGMGLMAAYQLIYF